MRKFVQKLTACLCLCALLGSSLTVPARAAGFTDVSSGHWAAEAISQCVTHGWFQGKNAATFGVGQPMTRAAFAVVLCRFFGWQDQGASYQIFSDVPQGAWYEPALRACYEHGAVTRQTDSFRPASAITREELAVMLIRALGYGSMAGLFSETSLPFRDVTTNRGYIAMAYEPHDAPELDFATGIRRITHQLADRLAMAWAARCDMRQIVVDPGIGFGKGLSNDLRLITESMKFLSILWRSVLIAHSRKRCIARATGLPIESLDTATAIASGLSFALGAAIVRVHAPQLSRQALMMSQVRWSRHD